MSVHICAEEDWPDVGEMGCCYGTAIYGPERCTCWEATYDLDQQPPRTDERLTTQPAPCIDCAYKSGSPERRGSKDYAGDTETLERIVIQREPFYCHQGIRRPVEHRHPSGAAIPGSPAAYRPPIVDGVPYRADGAPAMVCGGWATRVRTTQPQATLTGRHYFEHGQPVRVEAAWCDPCGTGTEEAERMLLAALRDCGIEVGRKPRFVVIRRRDGSLDTRTLRGLRRSPP